MKDFNGVVLYTPTEDDLQYLKNVLSHVKANKPDIKGIVSKHRIEHWWRDKFDWGSIKAELSRCEGWEYDLGETPYLKAGYYYYLEPCSWVTHISDILSMLSINKECYITPSQSRSLSVALNSGC